MDAVDERFPDASEKLSEQELFELVMQRMAVLPESQREAIELWSNGFCYSEIADVMERPQSSIRVLVHRAIARLRSDRQLAAAIGEDSGNPITVPAVGKF
jgi:DNA-directed RNA polymerase specialized sigma24 family protein